MTELRTVLNADAVVCFAFGAVFLAFAGPLVPLLTRGVSVIAGFEPAVALRTLGLAVLGIGAGVAAVARMRPIRPAAVAPILAVEVLWIAACGLLALGAAERLTTLGLLVVLASALAVAGFLALEVRGVQALTMASRPQRGRAQRAAEARRRSSTASAPGRSDSWTS